MINLPRQSAHHSSLFSPSFSNHNADDGDKVINLASFRKGKVKKAAFKSTSAKAPAKASAKTKTKPTKKEERKALALAEKEKKKAEKEKNKEDKLQAKAKAKADKEAVKAARAKKPAGRKRKPAFERFDNKSKKDKYKYRYYTIKPACSAAPKKLSRGSFCCDSPIINHDPHSNSTARPSYTD